MGFLPSSIGPAAHLGTNGGSVMQAGGMMPSGLPDTLLTDDMNSLAMRQRVPNGNARRDASARGQRGRAGVQPQGMLHRGRGAIRGAVRCAQQSTLAALGHKLQAFHQPVDIVYELAYLVYTVSKVLSICCSDLTPSPCHCATCAGQADACRPQWDALTVATKFQCSTPAATATALKIVRPAA